MVDHEMIASREAITQTALAIGNVQASHIAIYLTMIFTYISFAYIAGTKLTRLQLALTLFVFVAASAREVISIAALTAAASGKFAALLRNWRGYTGSSLEFFNVVSDTYMVDVNICLISFHVEFQTPQE